MTKEKIVSLEKHIEKMKNALEASTPKKHTNHPESYKRFLRNEIDAAKKKIDEAKLDGVK